MAYDKDVVNRLKRIEGQVRGIIRMIEDEKDCKDVINQMTAAKTAIDRAIGHTVMKNLEFYIEKQKQDELEDDALLTEAVELIIKSR